MRRSLVEPNVVQVHDAKISLSSDSIRPLLGCGLPGNGASETGYAGKRTVREGRFQDKDRRHHPAVIFVTLGGWSLGSTT